MAELTQKVKVLIGAKPITEKTPSLTSEASIGSQITEVAMNAP